MIKKITFAMPFVILVICVQNLLINFNSPAPNFKSADFIIDRKVEETPNENKLEIRKGLILKVIFLKSVLNEIKDPAVPGDGKPDKMVDRLERIILGESIALFLYIFLIFLSLSTFFSFLAKAWFSVLLGKTLYILSILFLLFNLNTYTDIATRVPYFGIPASILIFLAFVGSIIAYRNISKFGKEKNKTFLILKHHQTGEEEQKTIKDTAGETSIRKISFHFFLIIIAGILIGNLVYIPVFSVQKNYANEFGVLLFIAFGLLGLFYIRNYYNLSYNPEFSKWKNIFVSTSYLQYRFIKNTLSGIIVTIGVVVFITFIFTVLALNTNILRKSAIIERSNDL